MTEILLGSENDKMKPYRILHVVNEFAHVGNGIVNVACDLAYAQAQAGMTVAVASLDGDYVQLLEGENVAHYHLNLNDRSLNGIYSAQNDMKKAVRHFNPDIIHAHTMTAAVLSRINARSARVVSTVHNEYQKFSGLMRFGHVVVGVSESVSDSLISRGFPRKKVRTVLNGVVGSPRDKKSQDLNMPVLTDPAIVTIGMVSERKGSDILVEAFSSLAADYPSVDLYFVGNSHWPELIDSVVQGHLKERVHFLGFSKNPRSYLSPKTIFVLPSRRDPFPLVVLEAREAGAAIVGSDADGIPEALEYGEAGLVFESGSGSSLSECLRKLLHNEDLRSSFGNAAKNNMERFSVHAMASKYHDVYEYALGSRDE